MKLYLDDDSTSSLLLRLLLQAGHDVQLPKEVGYSGYADPIHLTHSINVNRILLSANHNDFRDLHNLVLTSGGMHPGILVVRYDNNARRDMTPRGIFYAVERLIQAKIPIENEFTILNQWR